MNRRELTSMILRLGVGISSALFIVGVLADAVDPIAFGTIKPDHIPLLAHALVHGSPAAMMHIGILVLLDGCRCMLIGEQRAVRVFAMAWSFARERDFAFATISIGVLLLLIVSFVVGAME